MKSEREQIVHAMSGRRMICPKRPMRTGLGRSAISLKSAGLSAKPKSNIRSVSIGSTIKIVFIIYLFCVNFAAKVQKKSHICKHMQDFRVKRSSFLLFCLDLAAKVITDTDGRFDSGRFFCQ